MEHLAETVVLGYCDIAAAGVRLLQHLAIEAGNIKEESAIVNNTPICVRNFFRGDESSPCMSVLLVKTPILADECTSLCSTLADFLESKKIVIVTAQAVPMSNDEEQTVFWTQYNHKSKIELSDIDFEQIPNGKWTLKDQFLCTCLHFFQVEYLPTTVVLVRGYKYLNKPNDGTNEVLVKLGHALPVVLESLDIAKTKIDIHASASTVITSILADDPPSFSKHSLLYN